MSNRQYGTLENFAHEIAQQPQTYPSSTSTTGVSMESVLDPFGLDQQQQTKLTQAQQKVLEELERKRRAKTIAIPTDDLKVRQVLRELGHPITLFGEGPFERRERLRDLLSRHENLSQKFLTRIMDKTHDMDIDELMEEDEDEDEEFFVPGSEELLHARMMITEFSLPRAKKRLQWQRGRQDTLKMSEMRQKRKNLYKNLSEFGLYATQVGSERPLSTCAVSPDSSHLLSGCFGGSLSLWSVPDGNILRRFKGHADRIGGISWNPLEINKFATGAGDGSISIWSDDQEDPLMRLDGHVLRVSGVDHHPSGRFLGTSSHDQSWRLWDLTTGQELLLQEGHSKELSGIKFHGDGSLVATIGNDCFGRIWDLRSGKALMLLSGHIQSIHSVDWSPNGFELLSASADHTIRLHDIRNLKSNLNIIPAHANLVSSVKFNCGGGFDSDFFVSSSFDKTIRIWGSGDLKCVSTLAGHENRIMAMDLSPNGQFIVSASYDRTFKIWKSE